MTPRSIVGGLPRLALLALAWCALTGGVFSGCRGLFTPAIPEPPRGAPIVLNYQTPEATLATMTEGMKAKGDGASAWLGAFADSSGSTDVAGYHQFFDDTDLAYYRGTCQCETPTDWRWSQEQEFYQDFLSVRPSDDYIASFEPVEAFPDPTPGDDEVRLYRRYRVDAIGLDESATVIAVGFAYLTFKKIAADRWLIIRWDDRVDPDVGVQPSDPEQQTLGRRRLESTR